MSKARVTTNEQRFEIVIAQNVLVENLLNPGDLAPEYALTVFDLISVPPVPLVRNARLSGHFYKLPEGIFLPLGMRFGI